MSSIFFLRHLVLFHGGSSFHRLKHLEKSDRRAFGIALTSKAVIGFCCLFQFLQFESYKRHRLSVILYL
ncbi:hypothetical protein P8452_08102 [Trifolium repens]|nr:hypothetical protein P8452_08102 [Trifolium repens]